LREEGDARRLLLTMLTTQMRNGENFTGQGLGGGLWAIETGRALQEAHDDYSLKKRRG
jgi:hypothetical protein